jgi:hypothetical protein
MPGLTTEAIGSAADYLGDILDRVGSKLGSDQSHDSAEVIATILSTLVKRFTGGAPTIFGAAAPDPEVDRIADRIAAKAGK